jgi:hypothetical protein
VEDNGDGFLKEEFERLMSGGIGNSEKRPKQLTLKHGRPTIGRLGIGMLGIAQVCGSFTITSRTAEGRGFRAKVRLYDLLKEKLDRDDKDVVHNDDPAAVEVDVGEYEFEKFNPEDVRKGTRLIADDLHPTFVRSFKESLEFEQFREPPMEWARALKVTAGVHSLQELGDYWRLLWELSAACPVPYVSERALPNGLVRDDQERLESYKFRLIVDSIELRKPIVLSGNPFGYSTWKIEPQSERIYGKDLRFRGYIVVQEGKQLRPDELRGLMIRINNVAIGYYDPSLLDYRFNEGPRSRWITGEILVEAGLEDALNIDRDSFNRFHPHFRAVQKYVHQFLRVKVFPETYKQIDVRSQERVNERTAQRTQHLRKVIAQTVDTPVQIRGASAGEKTATKVAVSRNKANLVLAVPKTLATKKSNQQLASSVLAIFEVSLRERNKDRQREVFTRLLLDLLNKW